jgi:serine/threonine-protein kinase
MKVAKDLRVGAVLMGKVTQRGENLVVQADLVGAEDGSQLWGQQFNRKASEFQALQEEIIRQITEKLRLKLSGEEEKRLAKRYTENPEAYNLYLQGRHYLDEETPETVPKSRVCFEQAIAKDPKFALAHAGLADAYSYTSMILEPPREVMPKAREEALKAIQLDSSAGEGHTSLGIVKLTYDWDWAGAGQELRRAAELSPNNFYVRHWYAHYLETSGRLREGMEIMRQILDADPLSPMILEDVYGEYIRAGQWDQALGISQRLAALMPNDPMALGLDPLAYERLGRHAEALAALEKLRVASGSNLMLRLAAGGALAILGKRAEAEKILAEVQDTAKKERPPPRTFLAQLCFAVGDKDQGFAYLDQAYEAREGALSFLNMWIGFDGVRDEPRFAALARKIGLPPMR